MAVESVTYINNYDPNLPSGGDSIAEGDDHLRNLKKGIKNTFPNITGEVTATHDDLNNASTMSTRLDAVEASLGDFVSINRGAAKYNNFNGLDWNTGIISGVTEREKGTYRVAFDTVMQNLEYSMVITAAATDGLPVIAFVTTQDTAFCDMQIRNISGDGTVSLPTNVGFNVIVLDSNS